MTREEAAMFDALLAKRKTAPTTSPDTGGEAITRDWLIRVVGEHAFAADAADMILERLATPRKAEWVLADTLTVPREELLDAIDVAISDSLDVDWRTMDGARAVAALFDEYGWTVAAAALPSECGGLASSPAAIPTEGHEAEVLDWKDAADGLCAEMLKQAPTQARKVADTLYETLLDTVQDYLRDNVGYNLSADLQRARRKEDEANAALRTVADGLKVETRGFPSYPTPEMVSDACLTAIEKLATPPSTPSSPGMKPLQAAECAKENTKEMGHE